MWKKRRNDNTVPFFESSSHRDFTPAGNVSQRTLFFFLFFFSFRFDRSSRILVPFFFYPRGEKLKWTKRSDHPNGVNVYSTRWWKPISTLSRGNEGNEGCTSFSLVSLDSRGISSITPLDYKLIIPRVMAPDFSTSPFNLITTTRSRAASKLPPPPLFPVRFCVPFSTFSRQLYRFAQVFPPPNFSLTRIRGAVPPVTFFPLPEPVPASLLPSRSFSFQRLQNFTPDSLNFSSPT